MNIYLSPFAFENLVSRDGFGSPVPRQPPHLHTMLNLAARVCITYQSNEKVEVGVTPGSPNFHRANMWILVKSFMLWKTSITFILLLSFFPLFFSLLSSFLATISLAGYFVHVRFLQSAFPCWFVSSPTVFPFDLVWLRLCCGHDWICSRSVNVR